MLAFHFHNPTEIFFGEGQIAQLRERLPRDKKILVIYGGGSILKNGVYQQISAALSEHQWHSFSGIEPNPQYDTLMQAVALIKEQGFDYLLAVGGGSVVDGTKFIAAAACYTGEDPWDICAKHAAVEDALPLAVVLTLPATGSESNAGSVVSRGQDKLFFMSPKVQPQFAVLDPSTTLSLSARQISNGVVDAFVHVMEQYLTYPVNAQVQDRFAESLLLTLIEQGPQALQQPDDLAVRSNIMWAATLALNGLIGVGVPQDWATHMLGHELTALHGVDHARSLSIVLPAMMKVRQQEKRAKLLQYASRVWGLNSGDEQQRIDGAIAATEQFFVQMQMPIRLQQVAIEPKHHAAIVSQLAHHGHRQLGEHGSCDLEVVAEVLNCAS